MADGYAQATGQPTHVNLHTAPGVGNAVGAIFTARANKAPLVDHRRPAGARPGHPRGPVDQSRRHRRPAAVRQVEPRAAARAGRARRDRTGHPSRHARPPRAGVRVDPDGRLGVRGRRGSRRACAPAGGGRPGGSRPGPAGPAGQPARVRTQPGARCRPGHRRRRRLERGGGARREAATAGVGAAPDGVQPDRVPRAPSELRGHPAAGHRPAVPGARGSASSACSAVRPSPACCMARGLGRVALGAGDRAMSLLVQAWLGVGYSGGAKVEPEPHPGGVGEVADDAARRAGKASDERRRGDDLVAGG